MVSLGGIVTSFDPRMSVMCSWKRCDLMVELPPSWSGNTTCWVAGSSTTVRVESNAEMPSAPSMRLGSARVMATARAAPLDSPRITRRVLSRSVRRSSTLSSWSMAATSPLR